MTFATLTYCKVKFIYGYDLITAIDKLKVYEMTGCDPSACSTCPMREIEEEIKKKLKEEKEKAEKEAAEAKPEHAEKAETEASKD